MPRTWQSRTVDLSLGPELDVWPAVFAYKIDSRAQKGAFKKNRNGAARARRARRRVRPARGTRPKSDSVGQRPKVMPRLAPYRVDVETGPQRGARVAAESRGDLVLGRSAGMAFAPTAV